MKILIVEDETKIAMALKKGLVQERYVVDTAYTGSQGLEMATGEEYDALIIDRRLGDMDGTQIVSHLRKQNNTVPILILTALGRPQDKIEGLDLGADDYLAKPFSFEELLARIRAITRRPKYTVTTELRVGDLKLNSKTFEVSRLEMSINLTSKEYSLLEFLMRNANRIVTKEQIISHVWDFDADVLPNTVEVYIKNLRGKIDLPFSSPTPSIKTVRGFGYKLA